MMRVRGILNAFVVFLMSLGGFLILVFVFINLPFAHRFVTQKVNSIFSTARLPLHIGSVNRVLPWKVYVQEVLIHDSKDDTIAYAGKVRSGFKPLALIKKRLILKAVYLEKARINILRKKGEDQLNIVKAFSGENEARSPDQTNNKPIEISIADAEVKDLNFIMSDSVAGIYVSESVNRIRIVINKMSLTEKTVLARSIKIEKATGILTLNSAADNEKSQPGSPWNIGLEEFSAENLNFVFDDAVNRQKLDLLARGIEVKARKTDFNRKIIDFDEISLLGTSAVLRMDNEDKKMVTGETGTSDSFPWDIRGDMINLQDVTFQMIKYSDTADYSPLSGFSVIGLNMKLADLKLNKTNITAGIVRCEV